MNDIRKHFVTNTAVTVLDLLGNQYANSMGSLVNLGADLSFMTRLDEIYSYPLIRHKSDRDWSILVSSLYLDTHKSFCLSMIDFMRLSNSTALMSVRKAIEHTLSSYHISKHPDDAEVYLKRDHPHYKKVFYNIKRYISENISEYPRAQSLIHFHEICSKYASHSTVEAHARHLQHLKDPMGHDLAVLLNYSEPLDLGGEFQAWYFSLLKIFYVMQEVYWDEFFNKRLHYHDHAHNELRQAYINKIHEKLRQYPHVSNKESIRLEVA